MHRFDMRLVETDRAMPRFDMRLVETDRAMPRFDMRLYSALYPPVVAHPHLFVAGRPHLRPLSAMRFAHVAGPDRCLRRYPDRAMVLT